MYVHATFIRFFNRTSKNLTDILTNAYFIRWSIKHTTFGIKNQRHGSRTLSRNILLRNLVATLSNFYALSIGAFAAAGNL